MNTETAREEATERADREEKPKKNTVTVNEIRDPEVLRERSLHKNNPEEELSWDVNGPIPRERGSKDGMFQSYRVTQNPLEPTHPLPNDPTYESIRPSSQNLEGRGRVA